MAYKILLFFFMLISNMSHSNIIYEKNGIIITEIEVRNYINIYENNNRIKISNNKAIKDIVLMKQTIKFLKKYNPKFMLILDQNIEMEFGENISSDKNLFDFIRFQKIRNEFITQYFQNEFDIQDLENIFSNLDVLKIPISKNNCLTVEKLHLINNDKNFIKDFYESLSNKKKIFKTMIDNQSYEICITNKLFNDIENIIIQYIKNETEKDFNKFIYSKLT